MDSPVEKVVPMRKRVAKACETCRAMKSKVRNCQGLGLHSDTIVLLTPWTFWTV